METKKKKFIRLTFFVLVYPFLILNFDLTQSINKWTSTLINGKLKIIPVTHIERVYYVNPYIIFILLDVIVFDDLYKLQLTLVYRWVT